ncbi:MAG: helix-turn-helix domain-containing protein [Clostridiales bacterium]|nr:helix-turn-helix domain-containing protein [Clostridiales bacterium]
MSTILLGVPESDELFWRQVSTQGQTDVKIIGNAARGQALLDLAADTLPQVIIVDLHLPGLENLELLTQLHSFCPNSHILCVAGNQGPEDSSAAEQFLKAAFFCRALADAPTGYSMLALSRDRSGAAKLKMRQYVGKLFFRWASNVAQDKQLDEAEANTLYDTCFVEEGYREFWICIDSQTANLKLKGADIINRCVEALQASLDSVCHEMLFNVDALRCSVLLNYERALDESVCRLLEECHSFLAQVVPKDVLVTFCCSNYHPHIRDIRTMMTEASDMMWSRFTCGSGTVLYSGHEAQLSPAQLDTIARTEQTLKAACTALNLEEFERVLRGFFALPREIVGHHRTRAMLREVESYMLRVNNDLICSFANVNQASRDIVLTLRTASTLETYVWLYAEKLLTLFRQIISHDEYSHTIRMAQSYVLEHYQEDLGLEEVAAHVGLSPGYLSARFKQETGTGFNDFLNRRRIEAAKELLAETNEKVQAIAYAVGYTSPRYFSQVFRALESLRPSEYRAAVRRGTPQTQ